MALEATSILLKDYVDTGNVPIDTFSLHNDSIDPQKLRDGEVVVELLYLSVDPYLRFRMHSKSVSYRYINSGGRRTTFLRYTLYLYTKRTAGATRCSYCKKQIHVLLCCCSGAPELLSQDPDMDLASRAPVIPHAALIRNVISSIV